MEAIANFIQQRLDVLRPKHQQAVERWRATHDSSWGNRVGELAGRIDELDKVLNRIQKRLS